MLCQLSIQNIALIDALNLEFTEGLNVLTGETGAGKSIVIDAMNLALGERADRDLIRAGQDRAVVEALFDASACRRSSPCWRRTAWRPRAAAHRLADDHPLRPQHRAAQWIAHPPQPPAPGDQRPG